jgi:hypothetical protein
MGATAVLDFLFIVEKVDWEESGFSQISQKEFISP